MIEPLVERIAALEADATATRAYVAALERSVEALRAEVGGLRDLIRRRVPPTPEQFARDLKVEMDAR